jgi:hypothetical protein
MWGEAELELVGSGECVGIGWSYVDEKGGGVESFDLERWGHGGLKSSEGMTLLVVQMACSAFPFC